MNIRSHLADYWKLTRMHRPIGILLLLWPTLWALWIAGGGVPPLWILAIFVAGTVLMRAAGCAINDYADRDFDAHVARTRERPLAAGRITSHEAVAVAVVLALAALAVAWPLPRAALWLAVPGAFIAATYPFMKRYTHWPQAYLGIAFSWGIPMAFAAVRQDVPWALAAALLACNFCWVIAYDTLYAMADRPDDLKIGVKSTAILFGSHDRLFVGLFHLAALTGLAAIGVWQGLGVAFFVGLAVAAGLAVAYQRMAYRRERIACFKAFVANNWFGAAIFVGLVVDFAVR
ncbi:MAG: 4-hydroxybenzoate octaprenyltransferase [Nevskiaceae bacterium]|nr:MAG: 4-hydroxybenzoate octaprenyltransferase [Nevskiaceae bacterium]TBR72016.1 MAG: 4-hydroxybenzoate octaprenyltransferase [Nevskiaceae bacterium]